MPWAEVVLVDTTVRGLSSRVPSHTGEATVDNATHFTAHRTLTVTMFVSSPACY